MFSMHDEVVWAKIGEVAEGSVIAWTRESVRKHPLEAFFVLGIALCFGTLFPAVLIIPQEGMAAQILSFYLSRIATYSPVLAGMFVVRVTQTGETRIPFARRSLPFVPAWLVAVIIQTASLKLTASSDVPLIALSLLSLPAALLPALIISSACTGTGGVKQMLSTLVRPTGGAVYYLVALLTFPSIHFLGAVVTNVADGNAWLPPLTQVADLGYPLVVTFFSVLLYSGGINEESGWRGFAQSRLQVKHSPLITSLILWVLAVIWHIPNDIVQYRRGGYLLVRIALYPCIILLFGWVYNRAKGSILAPAVFHASMNSMNPLMGVLPITTVGNILLVGFALIAVVSDRMWRRLPGDHPAVHQDAYTSASAKSSS